jgi:hypothetical protein
LKWQAGSGSCREKTTSEPFDESGVMGLPTGASWGLAG